MFTIYNDSGSDSTMVSNLFIDEYMNSANDAQIKVYLYLLRMMGAHRSASVSDMADQFNHTEKDVVRSLRYWEKKGLLNLDFDSSDTLVSIRLCHPGKKPEKAFQGRQPGPYPAMYSGMQTYPGMQTGFVSDGSGKADSSRVLAFSKPAESMLSDRPGENSLLRMASGGIYPAQASSSADILSGALSENIQDPAAEGGIRTVSSADSPAGSVSSSVSSDSASSHTVCDAASEMEAIEGFRNKPGRSQLLFVIEQYIGKPLSLSEIRIIYNISEGLHFSDEMIDYLLQYCVDRGKKDFRYIKKVAKNWAASGIMTPAQAEQAAVRESVSVRTGRTAGKKGRTSGSAGNADSQQDEAAFAAPCSDRKKQERASGKARSSNSFNQFEQNSYDFDALEEELLRY